MTSFKKHHDTLQSERKKRSPNHQVVSQLMKLTFPQRRKQILTTPQKLADILSEWAFLHSLITDGCSVSNLCPFVYYEILFYT